MKVATLKNIRKVSAPSAAEPTDGYSRARDALNHSGSVAIPRMAGNGSLQRMADDPV